MLDTKRLFNKLHASKIDTPLGQMLAIFDDSSLFLLEFVDRKNLDKILKTITDKLPSNFAFTNSEFLENVKNELKLYFEGKLKKFSITYTFGGTEFQRLVLNDLTNLPIGQICSYKDIAIRIGKPQAIRAVANAIASNKLAIVIPCHRVIASNGNFRGYSAGVERKRWLLIHEKANLLNSN